MNKTDKTDKTDKTVTTSEFYCGLYSDGYFDDCEFTANLSLIMSHLEWRDIIIMVDLYRMLMPIHGVIMEFGCKFGRNLCAFEELRTIFEPYNLTRKIIGFDTFEGLTDIHKKDGKVFKHKKAGAFSTPDGWEKVLENLLSVHAHLRLQDDRILHKIVKGDVRTTVPQYLRDNPETIIALAYFDLDIYEPTFACLKSIIPHLMQGSILVFDEICYDRWPGETIALMESIGINNVKLERLVYSQTKAFLRWKC